VFERQATHKYDVGQRVQLIATRLLTSPETDYEIAVSFPRAKASFAIALSASAKAMTGCPRKASCNGFDGPPDHGSRVAGLPTQRKIIAVAGM
jgi:hypothetical protein